MLEQLSALAPHQSSWDLPHWPNMAIAPVRLKINTPSEYEREPLGRAWWRREKVTEREKSDSNRALKERQAERLGMNWNPCSRSCLSRYVMVLVFSTLTDSGSLSHWAKTLVPTPPTTLASAAVELHRTAALWTLRKLPKLAVNVLTL